MRIRGLLLATFLVATLIPSAVYSWWSYSQSIDREFSEVRDRHLLIAENISVALKRYHTDVVTTFETIAVSMAKGNSSAQFTDLMHNMSLHCVVIVDEATGRVLSTSNHSLVDVSSKLSAARMQDLSALAEEESSKFSTVFPFNNTNVMFLVRRYGDKLAIAYVETNYFIELGKSVAFGERGHAAIVDHKGNVIAHPKDDWVTSSKNISAVSAVQRMINGETGIEQFYSPAMKGDMIAGLTTIEGPGWGIMVPQPVSEIYSKVNQNNSSILVALCIGLCIALVCAMISVNSLATPLERMARILKSNTSGKDLEKAKGRLGIIKVREISEFQHSYNRMVGRVKTANKHIRNLAYTDTVTGLPNREKFQLEVTKSLENSGEQGILIFVDLDNFKEINDIHGHETGDEFLRSCASKLVEITSTFHSKPGQSEPTVARIGGDEFTILVPGLTEHEEIETFLNKMRIELAKPSTDMSYISSCSASIGCAKYPENGKSVEDLIRHADIAMYQAKKLGKNKATIYSGNAGARTAAEIRRDVTIAIDENQLSLEYQPKICTSKNRVTGVEALVRWNHPELGPLTPDEWLPAINNSPMIANLGTWVINKAMQDHNKLLRSGLNLQMAVNIGSKHFIANGFIECLEAAAKHNDFDRSCFEIEITEDAIFASEKQADYALKKLKELGYLVSIDDFGKGYSNIARLANLPVDFIKIDRSIVSKAGSNPRIKTIMESTISMANDLNCKIIAEGVENWAQAELATHLGAHALQGHYFSKSMKVEDLVSWIDNAKINHPYWAQNSLRALAG